MSSLENNKHEKFCHVWHETGNKTEAYRQSHPASSRWKEATVNKRASELSKKGDILGRYQELQEIANKDHGITIKGLLKELQEARKIALEAETPQSSAAVSATMAKAKLVGLDVTKIEITEAESLTPWDSIVIGGE